MGLECGGSSLTNVMTKQDFNHIYEQSVYETRLRVAIALLPISGISHEDALLEADNFVKRLLEEDMHWVLNTLYHKG